MLCRCALNIYRVCLSGACLGNALAQMGGHTIIRIIGIRRMLWSLPLETRRFDALANSCGLAISGRIRVSALGAFCIIWRLCLITADTFFFCTLNSCAQGTSHAKTR